jgi:hypothetical protein
MKNFTTTEKMHTLAEFYALLHEFQGTTDEYGRDISYQKALEVINTKLGKYVNDNQDFWDWGGTVITGIPA